MPTPSELSIAAIPTVIAFASSLVVGPRGRPGCPPSPLQPPGFVFGIVWPVLYVLVGSATAVMWRVRHDASDVIAMIFLVVGLNVWWAAFGGPSCRDKSASLASIAALALGATALAARFATASRSAASLAAPLVAWMWFATLLSATSGAAI